MKILKARKKFLRQKNRSFGFTLIELLVVVAIIGLLMSMVVASLTAARVRARDAKRLNDMTQVLTGLDVMLNQVSGYPDTAAWNAAVGSDMSCGGITFFHVPSDALSSYSYTYTAGGLGFSGCGGTIYPTYKIQFQTEGDTAIGPAGTYWISPAGISTTPPF